MNVMGSFARDFKIEPRSIVFGISQKLFDGVDGLTRIGWTVGRGFYHSQAGELLQAAGYAGAVLAVEGARLPGNIRRLIEEHEWWAWWGVLEIMLGLAPPIPDFFGAGMPTRHP